MPRQIILPLAFVLMILISFVPIPVFPARVLFHPGGTTIVVGQGGEFVLRFRLRWDVPGELGYFSLCGISWTSPGENGTPSENFTFLGAVAYMEENGAPVQPLGIIFNEGVVGGNMVYTVVVDHTEGCPYDGIVVVELRFGAWGWGDVPHEPGVHTLNMVLTIDVPEGPQFISYSPPEPYIRVKVVPPARMVDVSISPSHQSGLPGEILDYVIAIANLGDVDDNFIVEASDEMGWSLTLSSSSLVIPARGNKLVKLSVLLPYNTAYSTTDNVRVTVRSQTDETVRAGASCVARVGSRKVGVSISPGEQRGTPGTTLVFAITVSNIGDVPDDYTLTVNDDLGWELSLSESSLAIPARENQTVMLEVTIPIDVDSSVKNGVSVVVTSLADNSVKASASCQAYVTTLERSAGLLISPSSLSGVPGSTLKYVIVVRNTGTVGDTYLLSASSARGWQTRLEPTMLHIRPGENGSAILRLIIPQEAKEGEATAVIVEAISQIDMTVMATATCEAVAKSARSPMTFAAIALLAAAAGVGCAFIVRKRLIISRPKKRGVLRST